MYMQALLAVRKKHHWSQIDLAVALQVSRSTVLRWETGKIEPPLYIMSALRELMDL